MKKSQFNRLNPADKAAVKELITNTPTALNTRLREAKKGHLDLPLFKQEDKQINLF